MQSRTFETWSRELPGLRQIRMRLALTLEQETNGFQAQAISSHCVGELAD